MTLAELCQPFQRPPGEPEKAGQNKKKTSLFAKNSKSPDTSLKNSLFLRDVSGDLLFYAKRLDFFFFLAGFFGSPGSLPARTSLWEQPEPCIGREAGPTPSIANPFETCMRGRPCASACQHCRNVLFTEVKTQILQKGVVSPR